MPVTRSSQQSQAGGEAGQVAQTRTKGTRSKVKDTGGGKNTPNIDAGAGMNNNLNGSRETGRESNGVMGMNGNGNGSETARRNRTRSSQSITSLPPAISAQPPPSITDPPPAPQNTSRQLPLRIHPIVYLSLAGPNPQRPPPSSSSSNDHPQPNPNALQQLQPFQDSQLDSQIARYLAEGEGLAAEELGGMIRRRDGGARGGDEGDEGYWREIRMPAVELHPRPLPPSAITYTYTPLPPLPSLLPELPPLPHNTTTFLPHSPPHWQKLSERSAHRDGEGEGESFELYDPLVDLAGAGAEDGQAGDNVGEDGGGGVKENGNGNGNLNGDSIAAETPPNRVRNGPPVLLSPIAINLENHNRNNNHLHPHRNDDSDTSSSSHPSHPAQPQPKPHPQAQIQAPPNRARPELEWLDPEMDELPDFEWGWDLSLTQMHDQTQVQGQSGGPIGDAVAGAGPNPAGDQPEPAGRYQRQELDPAGLAPGSVISQRERESLNYWRQSLSGSGSQSQRRREEARSVGVGGDQHAGSVGMGFGSKNPNMAEIERSITDDGQAVEAGFITFLTDPTASTAPAPPPSSTSHPPLAIDTESNLRPLPLQLDPFHIPERTPEPAAVTAARGAKAKAKTGPGAKKKRVQVESLPIGNTSAAAGRNKRKADKMDEADRVRVGRKDALNGLKEVRPMKQELSPFMLRQARSTGSAEGMNGERGAGMEVDGDDEGEGVFGMDVDEPARPATEAARNIGESSERQVDLVIGDETGSSGNERSEAVEREGSGEGRTVMVEEPESMEVDEADFQEEEEEMEDTEERKKLRRLILADGRFGKILELVEDQINVPVPEDGPAYRTRPDPALAAPLRAMPDPHPFHPDLQHLIRLRPKLRVRWIIPFHGPVYIPPGIDPITHTTVTTKSHQPSGAIYTLSPISHPGDTQDQAIFDITQRRRAEHIHWTANAFSKFWKGLLRLREKGTCGPISISATTTYPDPFRPMPAPLHIQQHRFLPSEMAQAAHPSPVRCQAGDHIRISCDLEHALIFRMWLGTRSFGFERPADTAKQKDKGKEKEYNPFLRIKLCLVGPLGEVLAVV